MAVANGGEGTVIETTHAVLPQRAKRSRRAGALDASKTAPAPEAETGRRETTSRDQLLGSVAAGHAAHADLVRLLLKDVCTSNERDARQFEYLDHTADVQLHAWGSTLSQAFEQVAACMFNYMTPLEGIEEELRKRLTSEKSNEPDLLDDRSVVRVVNVEDAKDLDSLMFQWLDELLFGFNTEYFVPVRIRVVELKAADGGAFRLTAVVVGGVFDAKRDVCGTEIKAITYSAMQILDVCNAEEEEKTSKGEKRVERRTPLDRADVYVIVDI